MDLRTNESDEVDDVDDDEEEEEDEEDASSDNLLDSLISNSSTQNITNSTTRNTTHTAPYVHIQRGRSPPPRYHGGDSGTPRYLIHCTSFHFVRSNSDSFYLNIKHQLTIARV